MQLSKLKRFLKASALLMLAALTVATLAPVTRAQEQINFNRRVLNLPGGLGNNLAAAGTTGNPASFLFPLGGANAGSNSTSDILTADLNGDGFTDILIGSLSSDEIALFLGRGNGSFVRAQLGALFNGAAINYSDARAFVNEPQNAQFGRVTSMVAVSGFSTATGFSRVAVAIDYTGVPAGSALAANSGDQVLYLDINQNGAALNNTAFFPSGVAATAFTSNPVALSIGSLDTGGGLDVAVLCSGEGSTAGVTGGFVAIDRAFNTSVDQRIGGGTAAGGAVIAENGQSGSLFDTRSYGSGPVPATGNSNTYGAGAAGNRRAFTITPVTGYGAGIAPRAISFGNGAHRDDGANDLFFVGVDFGSVGGAATIATPAPSKSVGEGVVFCLVNNQNANGNILRNARALSEAYDFGNTTPDVQGQQDGVIVRAGNVPSGVAVGDFNGDNRLDVATSNSGSGTVGVALSGTIATIQNSVGVTSGPTINSYPNTQVSFVQVGGSPNTVYVRDLNNDGRLDILGTNIATNGGYAVFGSATTAGTFVGGQIIATNTGAAPLGATRALAVSAPTINGIPGGGTVGGGFDFQSGNPGTLPDIVFSRTSTASAVAVRYGTAVAAASATFATVTLSSFVGVVEGRINSDTLPDVAIADRGADRLIVVTNGAAGFVSNTGATVTTFIDLGDLFPNIENGGISSLDGGDVDKNNTFDLVATVDGPNDQVLVLYNIGGFSDIDPRFTIRAFPIGGDPTAVKIADLAGPAGPGQGGATARDGAPEIIAVNRRSNTVTTLINNGAGIFGQGRVAETGGFDPLSQVLGDFNDDGRLDTAVLNRGRRSPFGTGTGEEDDSIVGILLGNGDGSFQATNFLIPVARSSVSIAAAGYGVVRNGVQIDTPDVNLDGWIDLAVAAQQGGGPSSDVPNPFFGGNEAGSLTVLFGDASRPGTFTRSTNPQPLIDTLNTGGRIGIYPGAADVRDGRTIGYGSIALNGDYNQNGRPDAHVGGVESNNGGIAFGGTGAGFGPLAVGFASTVTSLDNLSSAFGAQRTFNVFPSGANNQFLITARNPVDVDAVTGVVTASSFVVSATGTIVGQDVNDFNPGLGQIVPDVFNVTSIGRAYESDNVASVLNHAPIVTTSRGLADFEGPGRKVVIDEGVEKKITIRAADVDPSAPGSLRFRLVKFPNFVSMVDNNNGTATITIKPGLTDGSATANNGLGQAYDFQAEATDNDFRLPLTSSVFFRIFVKDKPTAPAILSVADVLMSVKETVITPVIATSATNRTLTLSTTFNQPFSTFAAQTDGRGSFTFKPDLDSQAGVYNVTVTATDDLGLTASQSFKLTVVGNNAPVIGVLSDITLGEGTLQSASVNVTNEADQQVTISISGQPSFVTFSPTGNGRGVINIAPRVGDAGSYTVTVAAADTGVRGFNAKSATPVTFRITVTPNVSISAASYAKKRLFIAGNGFGTTPTVTVNGKAVPSSLILAGSTNNSITAKGNKASLGLRKGSNTIQVTGTGGAKSNVYTLNLATDEEAND